MNKNLARLLGSKVLLSLADHPLHGQTFEVVQCNGRHQFVIGRLLKRSGEYRRGDDVRFSGTLLTSLKDVS